MGGEILIEFESKGSLVGPSGCTRAEAAARLGHPLFEGAPCNLLSVRGSVPSMTEIIEVNESSFETEVLGSSLPVLVDFFAPWCGPCKMLAPVLSQLALEFEGKIRFAKVDVDEAPGIAAAHNITGVPTLMLFLGGKKIKQVVGLTSPKALRGLLENATSVEAAAVPNSSATK